MNICEYLSSPLNSENKLPIELTPKKYVGKNISDIKAFLLSKGFNNIKLERLTEVDSKVKLESFSFY